MLLPVINFIMEKNIFERIEQCEYECIAGYLQNNSDWIKLKQPNKMNIEMFSTTISIDDLKNKINEWANNLSPKIILINVNANVMHDYYMDSAPPMICNTWHEYIAIVIYELPI